MNRVTELRNIFTSMQMRGLKEEKNTKHKSMF